MVVSVAAKERGLLGSSFLYDYPNHVRGRRRVYCVSVYVRNPRDSSRIEGPIVESRVEEAGRTCIGCLCVSDRRELKLVSKMALSVTGSQVLAASSLRVGVDQEIPLSTASIPRMIPTTALSVDRHGLPPTLQKDSSF
jgi:hypothetical protein